MPNALNQLRWLWLSWVALIIDLFTKWLAMQYLPFREPVVISPFFNLTLDFNTGAAFNFLRDQSGWQIWLFSGIAVVVSAAIIIWLKRMPKKYNWHAAGLSLILAGAVGNLTDRLLHGHVIDFISLHYHDYYWPTFNIADSAVCIGAMLFIFTLDHGKKA